MVFIASLSVAQHFGKEYAHVLRDIRDESLTIQNQAAEIKLRAERRTGQLLSEVPRDKGGRPEENSSHDGMSLDKKESVYQKVLKENNIPHQTAHRWQLVATEIRDEEFDEYIVKTKAKRQELTSAAVH